MKSLGSNGAHLKGDSAEITQRIYKGKLDSPKTRRSIRTAAFTPEIVVEVERRRRESIDSAEAWGFPSERLNHAAFQGQLLATAYGTEARKGGARLG